MLIVILFTVTVSDMKSRSAHAFLCVMMVVVVVVVVCVCVHVCVCAWSGWFLLQSPEMKLAFLLQFISRWKTFTSYVIGAEPDVGQRRRQPVTFFVYWRLHDVGHVSPWR